MTRRSADFELQDDRKQKVYTICEELRVDRNKLLLPRVVHDYVAITRSRWGLLVGAKLGNRADGYPPNRFAGVIQNGLAPNLLAVWSKLINNGETLEWLEEALQSHPMLLLDA
jgi:hypothetical protein